LPLFLSLNLLGSSAVTKDSPVIIIAFIIQIIGVLLGVAGITMFIRERSEWDVFRKPTYPILARIGIALMPGASLTYAMRMVVEVIRLWQTETLRQAKVAIPSEGLPAVIPSFAYLIILLSFGLSFAALVIPSYDKYRRVHVSAAVGVVGCAFACYVNAVFLVLVYHGVAASKTTLTVLTVVGYSLAGMLTIASALFVSRQQL